MTIHQSDAINNECELGKVLAEYQTCALDQLITAFDERVTFRMVDCAYDEGEPGAKAGQKSAARSVSALSIAGSIYPSVRLEPYLRRLFNLIISLFSFGVFLRHTWTHNPLGHHFLKPVYTGVRNETVFYVISRPRGI